MKACALGKFPTAALCLFLEIDQAEARATRASRTCPASSAYATPIGQNFCLAGELIAPPGDGVMAYGKTQAHILTTSDLQS
jgi:hypothetical protein